MHINDWSAIQTLFDKLNKQVEKAQKVTETLGAPRVYIKMLVELEVCCRLAHYAEAAALLERMLVAR